MSVKLTSNEIRKPTSLLRIIIIIIIIIKLIEFGQVKFLALKLIVFNLRVVMRDSFAEI
jgi:hypothetical protein